MAVIGECIYGFLANMGECMVWVSIFGDTQQ